MCIDVLATLFISCHDLNLCTSILRTIQTLRLEQRFVCVIKRNETFSNEKHPAGLETPQFMMLNDAKSEQILYASSGSEVDDNIVIEKKITVNLIILVRRR